MGEIENLRADVESLKANMRQQQRLTSDHAQRFDTLQTAWWKRVWFWLEGWPWRDLNAPQRQRRPWRGN